MGTGIHSLTSSSLDARRAKMKPQILTSIRLPVYFSFEHFDSLIHNACMVKMLDNAIYVLFVNTGRASINLQTIKTSRESEDQVSSQK